MLNIILAAHTCHIKGCQKNLVLDGNFDNNRECCMAKRSGWLVYDSLPDEIATGCINTPKLGERFCKQHCHDHQELDKHAQGKNLEDASMGISLGPVLRSAKKNNGEKQWGQVDEIIDKKCLRKKVFYKVCLPLL